MSKIPQNLVLLAVIANISKISGQPIKPRFDLVRDTLQFLSSGWIEDGEQSFKIIDPKQPINEPVDNFEIDNQPKNPKESSEIPGPDKNDILIKPVIFRCPLGQKFSAKRGKCFQPVLLKHRFG